ncbi:ABC transporter permease subunit [Microbacteriaceae bacterium 4G12]
MYRKIGLFTYQFVLASIGVILVAALPGLFKGIQVNIQSYWEEITKLVNKLFHITELTYKTRDAVRPLFPQIFIQYKETLLIFLIAFAVSLILAFIIVLAVLRMPSRVVQRTKAVFAFLESLPDIFIIVCFQFLMIWFFKKTNILLFRIATVGEQRSLFLPILCLSIPVTFLLIKILFQLMEDEMKKDYVTYAKARGFGYLYIVRRHMLRNVLFNLVHYSKTIIWFMLSNLIVIEYIFNVNGLVPFLLHYHSPEVFVIGVFLLYVPFFLFYSLFELFVPVVIRGE